MSKLPELIYYYTFLFYNYQKTKDKLVWLAARVLNTERDYLDNKKDFY